MSLTYSTAPAPDEDSELRAVCVEVGASGCQTTIVDDAGMRHVDGLDALPDHPLLLAVPGLIDGPRVVAASNLGWYDVDPVEALGLTGSAALLLGDAEAAALGEWALRGATSDLLYVGLGTGVGGAVVRDGSVVDNLLGHQTGFGAVRCRCGQVGCLETVAGGWALPWPLTDDDSSRAARAVATAIRAERLAAVEHVVVAGGLPASYPQLVELVAAELPGRAVTATAAPVGAKSAAAWGLLNAYARAGARGRG